MDGRPMFSTTHIEFNAVNSTNSVTYSLISRSTESISTQSKQIYKLRRIMVDSSTAAIDVYIGWLDGQEHTAINRNDYYCFVYNVISINKTNTILAFNGITPHVVDDNALTANNEFNIYTAATLNDLNKNRMRYLLTDTTYGNAESPINIDQLAGTYMYRIINGAGLSGTFPSGIGGNNGILIGFSSYLGSKEYPNMYLGGQIYFSFSNDYRIAQRYAAFSATFDSAWEPWRYHDVS